MYVLPISMGRSFSIATFIFLSITSVTSQAEEMDHSKHLAPLQLDHSQHQVPAQMDHSQHAAADNTADDPIYSNHSGHAGAWMFEYRYMRMFQEEALDITQEIDAINTLQTPQFTKDRTYGTGTDMLTNAGYNMNMDMHMLMIMYNQTRKLTWMVMINYLYNKMDMWDQMMLGDTPTSFVMDSQGMGDTQIFLTYQFAHTPLFDFSITGGINLPTGSIDQSDDITDMNGQEGIAPYAMQLGSGTYDIYSKFTVEGDKGGFNYGAEIYRINRTGYNTQYYNLGDNLRFSGWARYRFSFGTQLRSSLIQRVSSQVMGRDERMSDNTRYTGGKRLDGIIGLGQAFGDFAIYVDYAYPLLQRVNGVQMKTTGILYAGLQFMYM